MMMSTALSWLGRRATRSSAEGAVMTSAAIALPPPRRDLPALPPPFPPEAESGWDTRCISPRDFAEMAHELYVEGVFSWEDYCLVGFPSELHPDFDTTIGALIGARAEPDRPRDMLAQWEQRVDFERRYNRDAREVRRAERVLHILHHNGRPPRMVAAE